MRTRKVSRLMKVVLSDQRGQTMTEYAIVAALIAVTAMAAVQALGGGIANVFEKIVTAVTGV